MAPLIAGRLENTDQLHITTTICMRQMRERVMSQVSGLDHWIDGVPVHRCRKYRRVLTSEEVVLPSSQLDIQIWSSGLEISPMVVEIMSW